MSEQAVEPLLASAIWQARQTSDASRDGQNADRLSTSCRSIDDVILPGLSYGEGGLCALSHESDAGVQELLFAFLASHLMRTSGDVTVIDSRGFDLSGLYSYIIAKLSLQPHVNPNLPPRNLNTEAKSLLERVRIMRVFDVEGLFEALSEVRSTFHGIHVDGNTGSDTIAGLRSTIPDSQMAIDAPENDDLLAERAAAKHVVAEEAPISLSTTPHLLILDELSSLLMPIQRTDPTHASALLSTLMRSLRHLAQANNTACIIASSAQSARASSPKRGPLERNSAPPPPSPSIFASCTARPSFAKAMDAADVHLLVHRLPKTVEDARAVYGVSASDTHGFGEAESSVPPSKEKRRRDVKWVNCVEVLRDRHGGRKGRFAFFAVDRRGLVTDGL
ncbi:hypothetical protein ANO11243_023700 [Dothideomycetidae sp. 11243]|nr:hypothetical protein ANO11243_023700 [fungal sp. No.11243]